MLTKLWIMNQRISSKDNFGPQQCIVQLNSPFPEMDTRTCNGLLQQKQNDSYVREHIYVDAGSRVRGVFNLVLLLKVSTNRQQRTHLDFNLSKHNQPELRCRRGHIPVTHRGSALCYFSAQKVLATSVLSTSRDTANVFAH